MCKSRARAVGLTLLFIIVPIALEFMGLFTSMFTKFARFFPEHYYRPHTVLMGVDYPSWSDCVLALLAIMTVLMSASLYLASRRDLAK